MYYILIITKMGSYSSTEMTALKAKYLQRSLTKYDLMNLSPHDLNELNEFLNMYGLSKEKCAVIIIACKIVCNNEDFTMRLNDDLNTCTEIVYIKDTLNNYIYRLNYNYRYDHLAEQGYDEYTLQENSMMDPYIFTHPSQIKMYFDLKKSNCKCHCQKQS